MEHRSSSIQHSHYQFSYLPNRLTPTVQFILKERVHCLKTVLKHSLYTLKHLIYIHWLISYLTHLLYNLRRHAEVKRLVLHRVTAFHVVLLYLRLHFLQQNLKIIPV